MRCLLSILDVNDVCVELPADDSLDAEDDKTGYLSVVVDSFDK